MADHRIVSRKQEHVDLVVRADVRFRTRTTGLERYELTYNALPEIDAADVDTSTVLMGRPLRLPLLVSAMTGGYPDAEGINAQLAEVCAHMGIGMSVGSMRAVLQDASLGSTYRSVLTSRPPLLIANVGAVQLSRWHAEGTMLQHVAHLADLIEADVVGVHLNPLQELLQPEGETRFRGVLEAIGALVRAVDRPVVVKEVGAGISASVAQRLLDAGVQHIDVAGAGGTSWAGVEILRQDDPTQDDHLWDVGIPTADCVMSCRPICDAANATLIASGGITTGTEAAVAIAMGAHAVGMARPVLQALVDSGTTGVADLLSTWERHLRQWMFLTGSVDIAHLRAAQLQCRTL